MAELLQERGQSMAAQVACVDTLLRQDPVRPSCTNQMTQRSESIASQATLGAAEEIAVTEGTAETDDETRRAAWQASVRRLLLVAGLAVHARPEAGQGMSESEEESDDDGDGKDEAEHEESEERQESKGSEENAVGELMPSGASAEETPEDDSNDSEDELDPDAIVRQYLQHEAGADAGGLEGRQKTGEL